MEKTFSCSGKNFSHKKVLVIAELGTAHKGSLTKAKELIDRAVGAGADAVKFQIVYADEILHPKTGIVSLPGGKIPLYENFKRLECTPDFFMRIAEYCEKKQVLFSASSFGARSTDELAALNPAFIKIASPELNFVQLLEQAAEKNIPLILSSGVSTLSDIELAVSRCRKFLKKDLALLHCITSYPAPPDEYNLSLLEVLQKIFDCAVGISDHSHNEYLVPLLSIACGAAIVEKHFCLSNDDDGLDDKIALPPEKFSAMVRAIRQCEKYTVSEIQEKLFSLGFTETQIRQTLGNGKKALAQSEEKNYGRSNRSLHYLRDIKAGERIGKNDIAVLRTEKILSIGEHPKYLNYFIGSILQKDVQSGSGANFFDIIKRDNE